MGFFSTWLQKLHETFIETQYWKLMLEGFGNTIVITLGALLIGVLIGTLIAVIKYCAEGTKALKPLAWICDLYVTVIRGTPIVVQLLIAYTILFNGSFEACVFAFGVNSGAYVAEIIRGGLKDPRISPWTSVVAVEVAPDLKSCKAWISVLGDEEVRKSTLQGLKSAEGFIRRELARTINLRNTPDITFVMDQSIEYGVNMSHKIDEVIAADEQAQKPENEVVEDTEETEEGDE